MKGPFYQGLADLQVRIRDVGQEFEEAFGLDIAA